MKEEKKAPSVSAKEELSKMVMSKHMMWSKAKMALEEIMCLKDANGDNLFCQKNHWWAVFRLFVDRQVCNIRENRYKEFIELIEKLQLNMVNAELDMATLSNITQDIFRFPFVKWELKIPKDASTRWMTAFERMNLLAEKLKLSLKLKGF